MLLGGLFRLFKVGDGTVIKAIDEASDIPVCSSPGDSWDCTSQSSQSFKIVRVLEGCEKVAYVSYTFPCGT